MILGLLAVCPSVATAQCDKADQIHGATFGFAQYDCSTMTYSISPFPLIPSVGGGLSAEKESFDSHTVQSVFDAVADGETIRFGSGVFMANAKLEGKSKITIEGVDPPTNLNRCGFESGQSEDGSTLSSRTVNPANFTPKAHYYECQDPRAEIFPVFPPMKDFTSTLMITACADVTIRNLTIENLWPYQDACGSTNTASVDYLVFETNSSRALEIANSTDVQIESCRLRSKGKNTVIVYGSSTLELRHCNVSGSYFLLDAFSNGFATEVYALDTAFCGETLPIHPQWPDTHPLISLIDSTASRFENCRFVDQYVYIRRDSDGTKYPKGTTSDACSSRPVFNSNSGSISILGKTEAVAEAWLRYIYGPCTLVLSGNYPPEIELQDFCDSSLFPKGVTYSPVMPFEVIRLPNQTLNAYPPFPTTLPGYSHLLDPIRVVTQDPPRGAWVDGASTVYPFTFKVDLLGSKVRAQIEVTVVQAANAPQHLDLYLQPGGIGPSDACTGTLPLPDYVNDGFADFFKKVFYERGFFPTITQQPPAGAPIEIGGSTQVTLSGTFMMPQSNTPMDFRSVFNVSACETVPPTALCSTEPLTLYLGGNPLGGGESGPVRVSLDAEVPSRSKNSSSGVGAGSGPAVSADPALTEVTLALGEIDAGSSDNCGFVRLEVSPAPLTCDDVGTREEVDLVVIDACGNYSGCRAPVKVLDRLPPFFSLDPTNVDIRAFADACSYPCPDYLTYALSTAIDNCGFPTARTMIDLGGGNHADGAVYVPVASQSPEAGTPLGLGTHHVIVRIADKFGNEGVRTARIEVFDGTAPTLACPTDATGTRSGELVSFPLTATDCSGTQRFVFTITAKDFKSPLDPGTDAKLADGVDYQHADFGNGSGTVWLRDAAQGAKGRSTAEEAVVAQKKESPQERDRVEKRPSLMEDRAPQNTVDTTKLGRAEPRQSRPSIRENLLREDQSKDTITKSQEPVQLTTSPLAVPIIDGPGGTGPTDPDPLYFARIYTVTTKAIDASGNSSADCTFTYSVPAPRRYVGWKERNQRD